MLLTPQALRTIDPDLLKLLVELRPGSNTAERPGWKG
jgi:hypothetical protein